MQSGQDEPITPSKKKVDKPDPDSGRKSDTTDPKPRIVLTFRSDKTGAKTSNMKIVSTEEKLEDISPRRSSRTRHSKWDSEEENDALISPKKVSQPVSETDEASDSSHITPKRSTRRRSKEFSENVMANAIARKEKLNNEPQAALTRLSRRAIKPTAKVLANEELRIGVESQNNLRLGISSDKSPEEGVRTRRSANRNRAVESDTSQEGKVKPKVKLEEIEMIEDSSDSKSQDSEKKLKHLSGLGLKAKISDSAEDETMDSEERDPDETELMEGEEEVDDEDDDSEVISKLLEEDSDSDEDYSCRVRMPARQRRSTRQTCPTFEANDSDQESVLEEEEEEGGRPSRRRSSRKTVQMDSYMDYPCKDEDLFEVDDGDLEEKTSKRRKTRSHGDEEPRSEGDADKSSTAADAEGSEAAAPDDGDSRVVAACYCEMPSNVHAAPADLVEPVFCQALEMVDGVRAGCSAGAARRGRELQPLLRAGPRAPYRLLCRLHARQLRAHLCCPTCGVFCTQGVFYQCSFGHVFHLECAAAGGCAHCGVRAARWAGANVRLRRVRLAATPAARVFLPDQREHCTAAYLGFSSLDPSKLSQEPIIPEDLLPSPSIDLSKLCEEHEGDGSTIVELYDAIAAGETLEQLIPKIVSCSKSLDTGIAERGDKTVVHCAAERGRVGVLHALRGAGARLAPQDRARATPLVSALRLLLEKPEGAIKKSPEKMRAVVKEEEMEVEAEKGDEAQEELADDNDKDAEEGGRPSEEDLMKAVRYLIAAGCDVDVPGPEGMTALHVAAAHGHAAGAALLLAAGAARDPRDHGGWTPLVWAAEHRHPALVQQLLEAGADACATDTEGNACVHWCALGGCARSLQLLCAAAPRAPAARNVHHDTPLHVAARQGHYACVVVLLARGAKTDAVNTAGERPVDVATGTCRAAISLNMQMALIVNKKERPLQILSSDISNGREEWPVPCVNDVDDEPPPDDFNYVTRHVMPEVLPIDNTIDTLQGCSCTDACEAQCACVSLSVRRWAARGRLLPAFPYHEPPMLFECNHTCRCNAKKCTNRLVSRLTPLGSLFVRAEVFRTRSRGWGLRARTAVPRGAPLALYVGELLRAEAADARRTDNYLFALDLKPDLLEQCAHKTQLCVDAAAWGGAARFVNHSCRPRAAPVRVFAGTRDLRAPAVVLVALADLTPGDEITFDYGDKFWSVKSKWMKCECGEPDCRYPTVAAPDAEN